MVKPHNELAASFRVEGGVYWDLSEICGVISIAAIIRGAARFRGNTIPHNSAGTYLIGYPLLTEKTIYIWSCSCVCLKTPARGV